MPRSRPRAGLVLVASLLAGSLTPAGGEETTSPFPEAHRPAATPEGYHLPTPRGWRAERYDFPLSFAPTLPYAGHVMLRVPPGMDDPDSEERWTYYLLWWLEGAPAITADTLERDLTRYYDGLRRSLGPRARADGPSARARLRELPTLGDRPRRFVGTVEATDAWVTGRRGTLTLRVRILPCPDAGHTAVHMEISPRPRRHALWSVLEEIRRGFRCGG